MKLLVDTGADISVTPPPQGVKLSPRALRLQAANGTKIDTYGDKPLTLNIGLRQPIRWVFCMANVPYPIIGADLLHEYGLIVDLKQGCLIDRNSGNRSVGSYATASITDITTLTQTNRFSNILKEFPELLGNPSNRTATKHSVKHFIPTTGPPCLQRVRQLCPERLKIAKEEFQLMVDLGYARPSNSPWASPLHMAKKKNGDWRPCGDYRRLNEQTTPDRYPISLLQDYSSILAGKNIFSKIDLRRAFHHIPVAEEDIPKTAVITPFGLFEFTSMPFGLRNAAQSFQRFINEALSGLEFVYAYIDDLLIASNSTQQHEQHLRLVFQQLSKYGLCINADKCVFGASTVDFLGYRITPNGSAPLPDRVQALRDFPRPKTILELRRFLGAVNFYRRHISRAASIQAPLNDLLKDSKKNDRRPVPWTTESEKAFEEVKEKLAQATLLAHPISGAKLRVTCDASSTALGAVLEQQHNGTWQPLGFFSKKLSPAQKNYSTYDRELTAIFEAIKNFRHWVEAREFTVRTDHKPLIYAFRQQSDKASPRQIRQLGFISQFTTRIEHISGSDNDIADTFSRIDTMHTPVMIDHDELSRTQAADDELKQLLEQNETSLKFQKLTFGLDGQAIYCDVSTNNIRPFVPLGLRRKVYEALHNLAHPSGRSTVKIVAQRYVWPSMNKDITEWARNCIPCQRSKTARHAHTRFAAFPEPDERFDHVHLDLVGPLPESQGFRYCLTAIDRFTKWPEAIAIKDITASTVASVFYTHWISRFGCPKLLTTDQGSQFESALFTALSRLVGGKRIRTTAYHPASNGLVERWHRTLKAAIMCHQTPQWTQALPTVLLGLRTCYKEDLKASPAEYLYGSTLKVPGEFFTNTDPPVDPHSFLDEFRSHMRKIRPAPTTHHNKQKTFCFKDIETCTHVFLRVDAVKRPLDQPYSGPHRVVKRIDNRLFIIDVNGREVTVNIDRIKPAHLASDDIFGSAAHFRRALVNSGVPLHPTTSTCLPLQQRSAHAPNSQP